MNDLAALLALIGIVLLVLYASRRNFLSPLFRVTPIPFWCYFLPMIFGAAGFLTRESPIHLLLSKQLLPICLVFLLIGTDLRSLIQMGKTAFIAMLTAAIGILVGAWGTFALFGRWLGENSWMGFGALSASWIGGSMNMLAVKESIGVPDSIFAPLVIVDAFLSYSWMGILIAASGWQERWNDSLPSVIARSPALSLSPPKADAPLAQKGGTTKQSSFKNEIASTGFAGLAMTIFLFLIVAIFISFSCQWLGSKLPPVGGLFTAYTWTVLLVSTFSLLLSLTPLSRFANDKTTKFGYFLLFLLLTSIGARVDISAIAQAPLFLAAGIVWILIHALVLLAAGRFFKIPLFFLATASQANIGGPASAPIVAAVYQPQMASVGLLMAILGNVLGTYLGLLSASVCRAIGN
ncbi:MAG: DUF819 family protein [Candidatus Omnitrophica bacterium]|nr:DUF819 family protein [Candidatus Omnitrophota bacterium]